MLFSTGACDSHAVTDFYCGAEGFGSLARPFDDLIEFLTPRFCEPGHAQPGPAALNDIFLRRINPHLFQLGGLAENNHLESAADTGEGVGLPAGAGGAFAVAIAVFQQFAHRAVDAQAQAQFHREGEFRYLIILQIERRLAIENRLAFVEFDAPLQPAVIDVNVGARIDTTMGEGVDVIVHADAMGLVVQRDDDDVGMAPGFGNLFVGSSRSS